MEGLRAGAALLISTPTERRSGALRSPPPHPRWLFPPTTTVSPRVDLAHGHHLLPFLVFGACEGRTLLEAGATRLDAYLGKGRLQLGVLHHLVDVAVERPGDAPPPA